MQDSPIRKPNHRACERCGRQEVWDREAETWTIDREVTGDPVGDVHCIHEWDINGAFSAVQ